MTTVRNFLIAYSAIAGILMALISFVFLGSTLMNEFAGPADLGQALLGSAVVSLLLALPMAAVGTTSTHNDWLRRGAA